MKNITRERLLGYILCFCILSGTSFTSDAQEWTFTTIGSGIKPSLTLDPDNIPHIAFIDEAIQGYTKYAYIEDDVVNTSTVATGYFYGPPDIAISPNNLPHIVYHNHGTEDLELAMLRPNGTWMREQIQSTNHDGWDGSIFVSPNGDVHMASVDPSAGIEYAFYNTSSEIVELPGSGNFPYRWSTDIMVDPDGTVHIAYYQSSDGDLQYAKRENGIWSLESVVTGGAYPSMVRGEGNEINIAYYRTLSGSVGTISIATKTSEGWETYNVDTLSEVSTSSARHMVDLVYTNNELHITYCDRKYLFYGVLIDTTWKIETVLDYLGDPTTLGQLASLGVDEFEGPHIAYYEVSNTNPKGGTIKYATRQHIPLLLVDCPENHNFYCATDNSPENTGEPIVLNNPGLTINISYDDFFDPGDCISDGSLLTRSWVISNDLNQTVNCTQTIENRFFDLDELIFPPNHSIANLCIEDLKNMEFESIQNLCDTLTLTTIDSLINPRCTGGITMMRRNLISDDCDVLFVDTQMITIQSLVPFDIANVVVQPDSGNNSGSIEFDTECGAEPLTYFWSNGSTASSLQNLTAGTYSVTVIDDIQCLEVLNVTVPGLGSVPFLQGTIKRGDGSNIQNVDLTLQFLDDQVDFSSCSVNSSGIDYCIINTVDIEGEIELCLSKDEVAIAGVSAIDMVRAQRIILGLVDPCPYNLIAGDVNLSGTVSASDLVLMRRVILGFDSSFPSGKSWIFFRNDNEVECEIFTADQLPLLDLAYIGIKLGDLNCQDTPLNLQDQKIAEVRSSEKIFIEIEDRQMKKGERTWIPLHFQNPDRLLAFQYRLSAEPVQLRFIDSRNADIDLNLLDFRLQEDQLSLVAHSHEPLFIHRNTEIFWIEVEALRNIRLSEVLSLEESFDNVAYNSNEEEMAIDLVFHYTKAGENMSQNQAIQIYPNPFDHNVHIHSSELSESTPPSIILRDVSGRVVYTNKIPESAHNNNIELDLSFLKPGLYMIEIIGPNYRYTRKLVKTH